MRLHLSEIHLRDPFVYPKKDEQMYYLFGTIGETAWSGSPRGFDVYTSQDLEWWYGPFPAFRPKSDFWSDHHYWAPEIHAYKGKYYMFASFKSDLHCRATQILVAEHPLGPFIPHGKEPITPKNWECLDGTLHIDEENQPWIVFCREWLQVDDGEMWAIRLAPELDATIGEPTLLFRASEAPWVHPIKDEGQFVTDGPWLYRTELGDLLMMWSSFGEKGYAIGTARSITKQIAGPWRHDEVPLYSKDGGHGMIFETFNGCLILSIHSPNEHPHERPVFLNVHNDQGKLIIEDHL
jgi:arabinan endo-1,5-alpha-L-arabinosidase